LPMYAGLDYTTWYPNHLTGIQTKLGEGKVAVKFDADSLDKDTDIYTLAVNKIVSVTPLSLDLTSRVEPLKLRKILGIS